jgi:hypothetical protein
MHQLSNWQMFHVGRDANSTANSTAHELAKVSIKQGIDQVWS